MQKDRETNSLTEKPTEIQTDKEKYIEADMQTGRGETRQQIDKKTADMLMCSKLAVKQKEKHTARRDFIKTNAYSNMPRNREKGSLQKVKVKKKSIRAKNGAACDR